MRTELEYWNKRAGGGKQNTRNLCPGDELSKEHQVLVLEHCRRPEESQAQVDGLISPSARAVKLLVFKCNSSCFAALPGKQFCTFSVSCGVAFWSPFPLQFP